MNSFFVGDLVFIDRKHFANVAYEIKSIKKDHLNRDLYWLKSTEQAEYPSTPVITITRDTRELTHAKCPRLVKHQFS